MRCLTNSLAHSDSLLHPVARRVAERLATVGAPRSESVPEGAENPAVPRLDFRAAAAIALQRQVGGGFDRLTRTKTTSTMLKVQPYLALPTWIVGTCACLLFLYGCVHQTIGGDISGTSRILCPASWACKQISCNLGQGLGAEGIKLYMQHLQDTFLHPRQTSTNDNQEMHAEDLDDRLEGMEAGDKDARAAKPTEDMTR